MDANAERAGSRVHRNREGKPVEEHLCIRELRFCSLEILQLALRVYPRARNPTTSSSSLRSNSFLASCLAAENIFATAFFMPRSLENGSI